ncbi:MAG TPA: amino acid racemase [Burkholderiales bacterium]
MKLIGIVGGIGPESTIDYYRLFISIYRERRPDGGYPPVVINSIDLARALKLVSSNDLAGLAAYMLEEVRRLARAGATHGLLSSNTPHIVFDEIQHGSPIPLISIVETTCRAAVERKLRRVGLFGTRFTMQGGFYQKVFARERIEVAIPESGDQEFIHDTYLNELVNGVVRAETRDRYVAIARQMKIRQNIEALILGGTELPLLLRDAIDIGMTLLDTARLHVEAAVSELLSPEEARR